MQLVQHVVCFIYYCLPYSEATGGQQQQHLQVPACRDLLYPHTVHHHVYHHPQTEARPKLPALYYKEGQPLKDLGRFLDSQGEQGNLVEVWFCLCV